MKIIILLSILLLGFIGDALGQTRYLAVAGKGTEAGTLCADTSDATRCPTSQLVNASPGETWIANDGDYGAVNINCSTTHQNGTSGKSVTLRSKNDRLAIFTATASVPAVTLVNCNYWNIGQLGSGFQIKGLFSSTNDVSWMSLGTLSNVAVRGNLFHAMNTYNTCQGCVAIQYGVFNYDQGLISNSYFEYNEFYDAHNMFWVSQLANSVYRFNYHNTRAYPYADNGYGPVANITSFGRNTPGTDNTKILNNIFESSACMEFGAWGQSTDNLLAGNICLRSTGPAWKGEDDVSKGVVNHTVRDNVIVLPPDQLGLASTNGSFGIQNGGALNALIENNTVIGHPNVATGFAAGINDCIGCGGTGGNLLTQTARNNLMLNWTGAGAFGIEYAWNTWFAEFNGMFGNSCNYWRNGVGCLGAGNGTFDGGEIVIENTRSLGDPNLGGCYAFIRGAGYKSASSSPYHGTGKAGANIGAEVLYLLDDNGTKTTTALWNATTKEINLSLRGAVISGVNSSNGLSTLGSRFHPTCNFASDLPGYGVTIIVAITSPTSNPTHSTKVQLLDLSGTVK